MKILQRFFSGETKMVKELSGEELQARLREVQAELDSSTGDPLALIEERDVLLKRVQAARILHERQTNAAHQEKLRANSEDYRRRLMPVAHAVADLVPRLLWELRQLERFEKECFEQFGHVWEETKIPHNFAGPVADAINQASRTVEWDWTFVSDPQCKNELPTPKATPQLVIQAGATDIHGNRVNPDGTPASYRLPAGIAWLPPAVQ